MVTHIRLDELSSALLQFARLGAILLSRLSSCWLPAQTARVARRVQLKRFGAGRLTPKPMGLAASATLSFSETRGNTYPLPFAPPLRAAHQTTQDRYHDSH
jgi:hypothetical protein